MMIRTSLLAALVACLVSGCASVVADAERLARAGQPEQAVALLARAATEKPDDLEVRVALARQRELAVVRLATQVDAHRAAGRLDAARSTLVRLEAVDAEHARSVAARAELERAGRHERWLSQARESAAAGRFDDAEAGLRTLLAEAPGHPGARAEMLKLRERRKPAAPPPASLGPAFQKPVTVEYREAPLRAVLEGLGRTHGVNFVFDKDVRADAKVSILLKDVTIDDALRVILTTQQLERKLLNDSTLFIYPNTQSKQREHQDLVTRSFFLANTDVKQAQSMVRTLAKTRDLFVDERLNLMVVRDTPEVVRLVEKLLASLDLPEPEVMLEVEVLEIASSKIDELGLQWPDQVFYGLPSVAADGSPVTAITRGDRDRLRASIANPALVATLRETVSRGNTLANPRLRARNREKAKILIGEKLPVFASTAATANVAGTTTVSYLDVGIKLDVEPSVQLDNDVVMKVNLEVSTLIGRINGPAGSVGYQVGTRQATTSLRLRDGETQVLAGLIKDEDTKGISGLPVLADLPVAGRLFGRHTDQRVKSEVVLLITPRVIRNIALPDADVTLLAAGVDASPGAESLRLQGGAKVAVPIAGSAPVPALAPGAAVPSAAAGNLLLLSTSGQVEVGGTASVTLQNRGTASVSGEVEFDPRLLQSLDGGDRNVGRLAFALPPGGEKVFVLRVLEAGAGQSTEIVVVGASATRADGSSQPLQVQGDGTLSVAAR